MKKGRDTLFLVVFAGFLFLAVGALTAADVPDDIKIENQGYSNDKKGPVGLTHQKHIDEYKVSCNECHHVYKDGKNIWNEGDPVKKCMECHDPNTKQGNADRLMTAFHNNCKNCHKEAAGQGKENAPHKKCNDCHEKK